MRINFIVLLLSFYSVSGIYGQEVPIQSHAIDQNGQAVITIASSADKYYVLSVRNEPDGPYTQEVDIQLGQSGTTILSEAVSGYPVEHYKVNAYDISAPNDIDQDGINDVEELEKLGELSPFNPAIVADTTNGVPCIHSRIKFKELSYKGQEGLFNQNLWDVEFTKFYIFDADTDHPKIYFLNSEKHKLHSSFANAEGLGGGAGSGQLPGRIKGHLIFHPDVVSANGTLGTFRFGFDSNATWDFFTIQMAHDLIAANLPFLKNNLCYYPLEVGLMFYQAEQEVYDASRICVLLEEDIFADIEYLAMHVAEGFGLLRELDINETPSARDIVILASLPNELSRVGGIISSTPQTPLSHVNLRAIQDDVPNAFIKNAEDDDRISPLIGKYIYYKVEQSEFTIREATIEEVNAWYEDLRPDEEQIPPLDLTQTKILSLDDIDFEMADAFGAKCTNVATMLSFDFPAGTIPEGYGVPFYFYQEFMKYNDFFTQAEQILANPTFQTNLDTRISMLSDFRDQIEDAEMPQWMLDELQEMHESFPEGSSIRCRSSTNNEDLPGFIGAGLYSSKTQKPSEGHISKSIKEVFASMWNFRAFEEREFFRVDHFIASMGVLCHINYKDEQANGVGVSIDPIYQTEGTFYLNNQLGEDLITNPEALSTPEEILLDRDPVTEDDYTVINYSNQSVNQLILAEPYLDQMREYLTKIHDEFEILYNAENKDGFAMEIEYKITEEGQLSIKQARPWADFWSLQTNTVDVPEIGSDTRLSNHPNPFSTTTQLILKSPIQGIAELSVYTMDGRLVHSKDLGQVDLGRMVISLDLSAVDALSNMLLTRITVRNGNTRFETNTKMIKL